MNEVEHVEVEVVDLVIERDREILLRGLDRMIVAVEMEVTSMVVVVQLHKW